MIGGHDISFRSETPAQAAEGAIRIVLASWQDAIVEDAETGELRSPDINGIQRLPRELLIYENSASRDSWAVNGAIEENANSMIHIIWGDDSITVVVDDPDTAEMGAILKAIREHVNQDILWMRAKAA